jgi:hypothetical protein
MSLQLQVLLAVGYGYNTGTGVGRCGALIVSGLHQGQTLELKKNANTGTRKWLLMMKRQCGSSFKT